MGARVRGCTGGCTEVADEVHGRGRRAGAVLGAAAAGKWAAGEAGAAETVGAVASAAGERAALHGVRWRAARCLCGYCTARGGAVVAGGHGGVWRRGKLAVGRGAAAETVGAVARAAGEGAALHGVRWRAAQCPCAGGRHGAPTALGTSGGRAHIRACARNGREWREMRPAHHFSS